MTWTSPQCRNSSEGEHQTLSTESSNCEMPCEVYLLEASFLSCICSGHGNLASYSLSTTLAKLLLCNPIPIHMISSGDMMHRNKTE